MLKIRVEEVLSKRFLHVECNALTEINANFGVGINGLEDNVRYLKLEWGKKRSGPMSAVPEAKSAIDVEICGCPIRFLKIFQC